MWMGNRDASATRAGPEVQHSTARSMLDRRFETAMPADVPRLPQQSRMGPHDLLQALLSGEKLRSDLAVLVEARQELPLVLPKRQQRRDQLAALLGKLSAPGRHVIAPRRHAAAENRDELAVDLVGIGVDRAERDAAPVLAACPAVDNERRAQSRRIEIGRAEEVASAEQVAAGGCGRAPRRSPQ